MKIMMYITNLELKSGTHNVASMKRDVKIVLDVLCKERVFSFESSLRHHTSFSNINRNPIISLDQMVWMYEQLNMVFKLNLTLIIFLSHLL